MNGTMTMPYAVSLAMRPAGHHRPSEFGGAADRAAHRPHGDLLVRAERRRLLVGDLPHLCILLRAAARSAASASGLRRAAWYWGVLRILGSGLLIYGYRLGAARLVRKLFHSFTGDGLRCGNDHLFGGGLSLMGDDLREDSVALIQSRETQAGGGTLAFSTLRRTVKTW